MTDQKFYTNVLSAGTSTYNGLTVVGFNTSFEKEFDNYDDAVAAAKKTTFQTGDDTPVYKIAAIVREPQPDMEVEELK